MASDASGTSGAHDAPERSQAPGGQPADPELKALAGLRFKHDPALPITQRREEIAAALERHPVIIVAGDTGSGKSTQLPQYCLEAGRGTNGLIAHTQPRRLAARALAARIADELEQPVGSVVGYRVRFADAVSARTKVVLMTDGLLLAEVTSDPLLRRYDTIIVDEAHERTLNIDLLLGVLKRLLPRRPELRVIVTSATLDVERVAQFFGDAPIVSVSGRSHPIEVRYLEAEGDEEPDLPQAVLNAYRDVLAHPGPGGGGDVLVFLPGEREIRDVGEFLERSLDGDVDVLPLYSRLSWDRQSRIFQPSARRRVVLATNVAETSITVPGVRAVIDSGLARISRYSPRNRLQRLPIEPVSRASAEQRKGRCGRLGPGVCVRLYAEADFDGRPAFTEPEVLRTNLAALLLRLAADRLGAAEEFPFIDPPDARALGDGYRLLQELEALDAERRITRRGRAMARLPLDPALARALLESERFHAQAEVLAVVAGLSVPDALLAAEEGRGDDAPPGESFQDGRSEFLSLVKLWRAYRAMREGPRRELRRWCKERGLSLLRLSEWDDVHSQVVDRAAELGIVAQRRPASYTAVHRSLLAGFCTMVGTRGEDGAYSGTRGVRFHLLPGSALRRRRPSWIMAANIVETSRVFARRVAVIEPKWVEAAAQHLLKREYLEPDWDEMREEVIARERIGLLGLVLSAGRVVNYGPIAPEQSRLIFAREALVHHRLGRRPEWLRSNDAAIAAARRMEDRLRSRDLLQGEERFVEFYDRALPRQVSSAATLEYFSRHLSAEQRERLTLQHADIFAREPDPELLARHPEAMTLEVAADPHAEGARVSIGIDYRFAPGEPDDGATLIVPLPALPNLTRASVDAAVPGLAQPRIEALLRSLPKEARRPLIPVAGTAASFIAQAGAQGSDPQGLARWLQRARGLPAALLRFDPAAVPPHLVVRLAVRDGDDELARGSDLGALRRGCARAARTLLDRFARAQWPEPWRRFEADEFSRTRLLAVEGGHVAVYQGLCPTEEGSVVRYDWSAAEAERSHRRGVIDLAGLLLDRQVRELTRKVQADTAFMLGATPYFSGGELLSLLMRRAMGHAFFASMEAPRARAAFGLMLERARDQLPASVETTVSEVRTWVGAGRAVRLLLDDPRAGRSAALATATREHLARLFANRNIEDAADPWGRNLVRYIKGEERRWERVLARGAEAAHIAEEIARHEADMRRMSALVSAELRWLPALEELNVRLEEYRISLYAQGLKTAGAISSKRLAAQADEIAAWLTR